jgi:class 3 adenylate cyclase
MTGILRSCVVLFVDISGSSRLYVELGDAPASKRVRDCLSLLQRVVEDNAGRVIKSVGDGLMCEFIDVNRALEAAKAMQVAVASGTDSSAKLGIHVGCHYGQVIENAGDLYGGTVNIASRVAGVARAGQVITTQEIVNLLRDELQWELRVLDSISVKGRRDELAVFEYLWQAPADRTVAVAPAARPQNARLRLNFRGREVWLDRLGSGSVTLGRDPACEVSVHDREASRQHATIEVRGNKFVVIDHSSNGTYVAWEITTETWLRREEMILPPRGRISLGHSTFAPGATVVEFSQE